MCLDCGKTISHKGARGLCKRCYDRHWSTGTLIDYERTYRPQGELLTEWDELRRDGWTRANAAERIGVSLNALNQAISRANRKAA